jgi:Sulfotransferase domain
MPAIGFLIIGAPKAGTTSLFEYLREHPEIHMPGEKEVYYFNMDRNYRRGWDWYQATVTRNAPAGAICGEATTEYISGAPYNDENDDEATPDRNGGPIEELIPRRIRKALPDVKLICVLRDPVKRAYSHYRMMVLSRAERRSFDDVVAHLTSPDMLVESRAFRTRVNGYVVNGEYARLLNGFLRVFPRDQLKVIFSDELAANPLETASEIFDFIGVADDFIPATIGTRFRQAATKERVPGLNLIAWQSMVARSRIARSLWHSLSDRARNSVDRAYNVANYRVEIWNGRRGVPDDDMSPNAQRILMAHYLADSQTLASMLDRDIPWLLSWRAPDEALRNSLGSGPATGTSVAPGQGV